MKRGTPQWRASVAAGAHGVRPHPFVREVLKRYGTVSAWARLRGVSVKTVSSWYARRSKKTIPRRWADLIASEFRDEKSGRSLVPATVKTWPNGIL